jgi:hypothetical protein
MTNYTDSSSSDTGRTEESTKGVQDESTFTNNTRAADGIRRMNVGEGSGIVDTLVRRPAPRIEDAQSRQGARGAAANAGAFGELPAEISFVDARGARSSVALAVEYTETPAQLRELLDSVQDSGGATRARLEASLAMGSILARSDLSRLALFRFGSGESLLGWMLAVREPGAFEIKAGPLPLFRARHERLRLIGGYSMSAAEHANGSDLHAAVARLLTILRPRFMVLMQTVSAEERLARVADALGAAGMPRFAAQYEPRPRYGVRTAENFEAYLAQLNSKWRSTFRRSLRNFDSHFEGQTELRCFTRADEVVAFVDDAEKISRRTWQWNEPGRGMRDRPAVEARLRLAAQCGHFKAFILYGRGEPLAFVEGYLAGGCYIPLQIGYLNDLPSLSLGTVCQLRLLSYLHGLPQSRRPHFVDYMDGDEDWKRSLATLKTTETSYRAFPDGLKWGCAIALSGLMRRLAGLKRLIRKAPTSGVKAAGWLLPIMSEDFGLFTELLYQF